MTTELPEGGTGGSVVELVVVVVVVSGDCWSFKHVSSPSVKSCCVVTVKSLYNGSQGTAHMNPL